MILILTFLLIFATSPVQAGSTENHMAVDHVECICVAPICVNESCSVIKFGPLDYGLSFRAFITQAQPKLTLQIRNFQYTPKKEWKMSYINVKIDYCEFAKGSSIPILTVFVPELREKLGSLLRPCPYEGAIDFKNFTFEMGREVVRIPKGTKKKVEVKFLNGKRLPVIGFALYNKAV